ncbi:MAG: CPBP family intramembrane metalloprotease [Bacteroidaceae bacterium]|nr:CPBP family intramembrane metalloprotease [Bacteroidaceae bacterium]
MKKTLTTIGIWIAAQLVITLILMIVAMAQGKDFNTVLAPALLISDFLVIVLLLLMKYCGLKELFKTIPGDIFLISMIFGICAIFAVDLISSSVDIPNMLEEQFKDMSKTVSGFLGICIIGPIMEEIMMRRIILKEMEKLTKSMWWGIIISAALFSIVHVNPVQVVFAMPAGIILGWLYCKTGSLLVPISLHILNNTISFITMRIGVESELSVKSTLGTVLFVVFALITVLSVIWINRRYKAMVVPESESSDSACVINTEDTPA